MNKNARIGLGIDSHALRNAMYEKEAFVWVGGIQVPCKKIIVAHSDGDVVLHAVFNAIASALGEKSIGEFFPNTDMENKGKPSSEFLDFVLGIMREKNYSIGNVSIVMECQFPKIAPHREKIVRNLSLLLGIPEENIGLHATTGEGLTSFGKGEGIHAQAMVLLEHTGE